METAHAVLSLKHLRYQQISVPNLEDSGDPIQRFQDAQVHGLRCYCRQPNVCNGWKAHASVFAGELHSIRTVPVVVLSRAGKHTFAAIQQIIAIAQRFPNLTVR
jgi:hypothetical protein